ncbi:GNAT family N-acetyltransferase [Corynebacterium uropygiale]|uniref:GNAT family N-acetyltransferase n=1 Tax=Corynebacterium uropygiale TaxID=1775911 RepID=A0A9X1TZD3_9CORY|nr:GNAT family protein [Corynebacterium uropygiale]MCF4006771.1 GNAT family N-acetyltransferase [Corynebacterium uropygiale]
MFLPLSNGREAPTHPGWPLATPAVRLLDGGRVRLRPLRASDKREWIEQRLLDEPHLRPVETTAPQGWEEAHSPGAWWTMFFSLRTAARKGMVLPLVIEVDGHFAGQTTLGNIQHGATSDCWIGYWVFSRYHHRGIATAACALGTDHALYRVGLHRVTATYLPNNVASGKVLEACGFRTEGFLHANLHIDGQWRDHHFVALNREDFPGTCVRRLRESGRLR